MESHREPIKAWMKSEKLWEQSWGSLYLTQSTAVCWNVVNQALNVKKKVMKVGTFIAGKVKSSCLGINERKTELYGGVSLIWKLHISYCANWYNHTLGNPGRKPWSHCFIPSSHNRLTFNTPSLSVFCNPGSIRENLNHCNIFPVGSLPPIVIFLIQTFRCLHAHRDGS